MNTICIQNPGRFPNPIPQMASTPSLHPTGPATIPAIIAAAATDTIANSTQGKSRESITIRTGANLSVTVRRPFHRDVNRKEGTELYGEGVHTCDMLPVMQVLTALRSPPTNLAMHCSWPVTSAQVVISQGATKAEH